MFCGNFLVFFSLSLFWPHHCAKVQVRAVIALDWWYPFKFSQLLTQIHLSHKDKERENTEREGERERGVASKAKKEATGHAANRAQSRGQSLYK